MTRRIYKKPHRAKKHKPLIAKASFWRSICVFAVLCGSVWLVCFSPALEVKDIEVAGAEKVSEQDCAKVIHDEVNKKIAFLDSKSILLFNMEQTKKELLARFPQVQNIKIERQFPSKIIASVEERSGVAIMGDGSGKKFLVDGNGIAFEEVFEQKELLEISVAAGRPLKVGDEAVSKEMLSGILRIKGDMLASSGINTVGASIETPERINLQTQDGWYVYFNPLKDIDSQLSKLAAVIGDESFKAKKANLEYVDVRFTRVYLKQKVEN